MGLLGSLIPGLRELRAPLAAGTILLLAAWIAVDTSLPEEEEATGVYRSLLELGEIFSVLGTGAALGFGAYLVGSLYTSLAGPRVAGLERHLGTLRIAIRALFRGSAARAPASDTTDRVLPPDERDAEVAAKEVRGDFGGTEVLTGMGVRSLRTHIRQGVGELRRALESNQFDFERAPPGADIRGLLRRAHREEHPWLFIEDELYRRVRNDFRLIRRRLIGKESELFSEIDRLRSEAELREAIAPPLFVLAVVLGWKADPTIARGAWVCGGLLLFALLLWQARKQREEAGDALVDALVNERVTAPALDRFIADVNVLVERLVDARVRS